MKNIFEKLDLSGIEKAIMKDDCIVKFYARPDYKIIILIENNDKNSTVIGYGNADSFIHALVTASYDYEGIEIENNDITEEKIKLFCVIDLLLQKNNIIYMEKENNQLKTSIKNINEEEITDFHCKDLTTALKQLDSYISSLNTKDLYFLYKKNLSQIEPEHIFEYEFIDNNGIQRRKK